MSMDRRYVTGTYLPLREAIDRLMEGSVIAPGTLSAGSFPPTDLYVTEDAVIVEMAVPGANPDAINISVTGDSVGVSGEVTHKHAGQKGQPYLNEIWRGKFQRSFTVPIEVDAGKAEAAYEDGMLTLTLPKSEATKPRKIQVKTSGASGGSGQETVPVQSE